MLLLFPALDLAMALSIISLNARCLRENVQSKALFLFTKQFNLDFVLFQESHSGASDVNFWRSQWGNDIWFGYLVSWISTLSVSGRKKIKINSECDENGHFISLVLKSFSVTFIVVNINSKPDNDQLLFLFEERLIYWLSKFPIAYLILGGDFNVVLN